MYILNLLNYLSPFSVATDLLVCHLLFLQKENVLKGLRFFVLNLSFSCIKNQVDTSFLYSSNLPPRVHTLFF